MGGSGQVGFGPLERIDGPPPLPPLYGLLPAASAPAAGVRIVTDFGDGPVQEAEVRRLIDEGILAASAGQERWINGVQVYSYPPDLAVAWDACAEGSDRPVKGDGAELRLPEFGAFVLWLAETCTAYNVPNQDEFKARAVAAFTAVESAGVAHEFLTGDVLGLNPHLSDGSGTFPNGNAATSPVNGLALLEGEIAKSGKLGLIHMSPVTATLLRNNYVVDNKTGVLRTINGNVVIPDPGYIDGATPAGHTAAGPHEEWIYATGPIDIRRSEIFTTPTNVAEALDRGIGGKPNSITYRAERFYLVDWDTYVQAAVRVDRCLETC